MGTTTTESIRSVSLVPTTVRIARPSQSVCHALQILIESPMELCVLVALDTTTMECQLCALLVLLFVWNALTIWCAQFAIRLCSVNCLSATAIASASSTTPTRWPLRLFCASLATTPALLVQEEPTTTASPANRTGTSPATCVHAISGTMRALAFVTCVILSARLALGSPTIARVASVVRWSTTLACVTVVSTPVPISAIPAIPSAKSVRGLPPSAHNATLLNSPV